MRITNETIAKLTNKELQDLGVLNIGIILYSGTLKKRIKSETLKVTTYTEEIVVYENQYIKHEFIKLVGQSEWDGVLYNNYAYRVFNKNTLQYETDVQVLSGLYFLK